jgi:hypothetical protein
MAQTLAVYDDVQQTYRPADPASPPRLPAWLHVQAVPDRDWTLFHSLGATMLEIVIFDDLGRHVLAEPDWGSATSTTITLRFASPLAGRAYVRPLN